jgi:predicted CXXCH cytochrome family protein
MSTKSRYLHGPVAVGACSVCHSVHKAKASNLLATAGKTLCFKCHNEKRFGAATKHPAMKGSCIDCHSSHGGNNRYFVRASAGGNPIQSRR